MSTSGRDPKRKLFHLLDLPTELLAAICGCLEHDRQVLKALRLTCKILKDIAPHFLFKTIYLNMDTESWSMLNYFADDSVLSKCIQRILCETGMLPDLPDYKAWEREVLASQEGSEPLSAEQLQDHYEKFDSRRGAEQKLLHEFIHPSPEPPKLQLKLLQLPKIQSIETVSGTHAALSKKENETR